MSEKRMIVMGYFTASEIHWLALAEQLSQRAGEPVLYGWQIANIVHHLGGKYRKRTIQNHLQTRRLRALDLGVYPPAYGVDKDIVVYHVSAVWQYLQSLEEKGIIQLRARGIESAVDIIDRKLDKGFYQDGERPLGFGGSRGKKVGRKMSQEGAGPWQENAIRYLEE